MRIDERLNLHLLRRMVRTDEGRLFVLATFACSEAAPNGDGIFENMIGFIDNPKIKRLLGRHFEDERRHERLFHEAHAALAAELGKAPGPPVVERRLLHVRIVEEFTGPIPSRPVRSAREFATAALLIGVLERRVVRHLRLLLQAMQERSAPEAELFAQVLKDEERHLKWCRVLVNAVDVDAEWLKAERRRLTVLEEVAFHLHNFRASTSIFSLGVLRGLPGEGWFWRGVVGGWLAVHRVRVWLLLSAGPRFSRLASRIGLFAGVPAGADR